jgi:hypothetical protein
MKRVVFYGDDLIQVELPENTRIIEPPDPLPPLRDYREAVRNSLRQPLGSPPLHQLVRPNSRITIAFDDPCLPLPPMKRDLRGVAMEVICEELFSLGVPKNNLKMVCAVGLHRKWTTGELQHLVGRRLWAELGPARISNHDAEDPHNLVHLGTTPEGYEVEINRACTDSDLTIYVNINWTSMNGGWKSYLVGLGTYRSIRAHHNPRALVNGRTIMDPESEFHKILKSQGQHLSRHARLFSVETVLNNQVWSPFMKHFLSLSRDTVPLVFTLSRRMPQTLKSLVSSNLRSSYAPIAVHAGNPEEVHHMTLESLFRQQNVEVEEESDALFLSLPNMSPYAAFSRINPLLSANTALGYVFNLHLGKPPVREGGVLILMHPFLPGFNRRHHLPYIEFYERVLAATRDPLEMEREFEEDFASREEYIHAYRNHFSYHGVHPFYVWYWGCLAIKHLSRIIVVGAKDKKVLDRMGFEAANSLEEAWRMAEDSLGRGYSITHLCMPPIFAVKMRGK